MLQAGHVNVNRLCHLIIDDADVVTKEFHTEVSNFIAVTIYLISNFIAITISLVILLQSLSN